MHYFFFCRDNPGVGALRKQTEQAHWAFMDDYAAGFVARGPTLTADGSAQTGSMHIVDLPDAAAVQRFAYEEPRHKAGLYGEVIIGRWRNESGRTMWEYAAPLGDEQRFLIIAQGDPAAAGKAEALLAARREHLVPHGAEERVIVTGSLLNDAGNAWAGTVLMIQMPDRAAFDALWREDPLVQAGAYRSVEVHRWMFGGRR
ncbi:MAG: YciI family protein [Burkholderiales bacterium]